MGKRLKDYLAAMDARLAAGGAGDWDAVRREHLRQLAFFQHERLVHLLVTLSFGLMAMGVGVALYFAFCPALCLLFAALLCLLIPYIAHYYRLENGVQKMYRQDDRLRALADGLIPPASGEK